MAAGPLHRGEGAHEANGVRFRLQAKIEGFTGRETVDGVLLEGGERLAADVVVLGVGVTPATSFATRLVSAETHLALASACSSLAKRS